MSAQTSMSEYQVKALFLLNFVKYVDWPEASGPIVIGILGQDTLDPTNQFSLRSSFDLPNHVSIDVGGRFVDKIAGANGYFVADARVAWKPTPNWEVSAVGQNLLDSNHVENPNVFNNAAYVGPEVYGKVTFKF